jgi:hypothetical protein
MKRIFIFLLSILILSIYPIVQAQDNDKLLDFADFEKSKNSKFLTGDSGKNYQNGKFYTNSVYKSSDLTINPTLVNSNQLSKVFKINTDKAGSYFFAANVLAANNVEKLSKTASAKKELVDLSEIRVYINEEYVGILKTTKLDWELVSLQGSKQIQLLSGQNTIRFESDAPYYPLVDAIRITEDMKDLIVENKEYINFVNQLKTSSDKNSIRNDKTKRSQIEIDNIANTEKNGKTNNSKLKSAMLPSSSYNWQVNPTILLNPLGNYKHMMQVPITYTYYRKLSLTAGTYRFNTAPIASQSYYAVDPVMYLYKINDPHRYSFYNDDASGYGFQSYITASNIPAGDYYLVIRAYSGYYATTELGRQGLVNVYQNGYLLNSEVPVAGYMFDVSSPNTGVLNFFTSYTTGIPIIWLQDNNGKKMKFMGGQYFYADPMDYMWWDDARMRLTKYSSETYSMMISAEGAMGFYFGNCDAYGSCMATTGIAPSSSFPNLKHNDAIQSAPINGLYNCTAWAGGFTDGWVWHQDNKTYLPIEHDHTNQIWNTWDDYFGNNPIRYGGAPTYTNDQADANNAEIALWSTNGSFSGVTHGSVRLIANNHPHGYDWESKAGPNYRFFHPKNALNGPVYGSIFTYYRDASKEPYPYYYSTASGVKSSVLRSAKIHTNEPVLTMEESIKKGLTVVEDVKLDYYQMDLIRSKSIKMKSASVLQTLYDSWLVKIQSPEMSVVSNPYVFLDTEEGKHLLDYAKNNLEESITFFANVVFANEESTFEKHIAEYLFCEIAKDRYASVMADIKEEWANNNYDNEGRYKAPMPETFTKKYIKKLLDKVVLKKAETIEQSEERMLDNHSLVSISPNPADDYAIVNLDLHGQSTVTLRIYNQSALVETILNGKRLEAGKHSFTLNTSKLSSAVYVCIIEIDGVSYARKFLKR